MRSKQGTSERSATSTVALHTDAMSKCPFYQVHMHRHPGASDSGSQMRLYQPFPWCSHEHSPVSMQDATGTAGEHQLKCGGNLAKCQVPDRWRPARET